MYLRPATLKGNPSKLQSHVCANNKPFGKKIQINLIFLSKFLCISNICSTFAVAKVWSTIMTTLSHKEKEAIDIKLEYEEIFKEKQYYPAMEISFLAVKDEYQGLDVGTRIIDAIFQMVKDRAIAGCQFVTVMAYDKPSYSAVDFYKKMGFTRIGESSYDTVRMYKPIYTLSDDYFFID